MQSREQTRSTEGGRRAASGTPVPAFEAPAFEVLFRGEVPAELQARIVEHIRSRRWFRGKARAVQRLEVVDRVPLRAAPNAVDLFLVRVRYEVDSDEVYVMPLASGPEARGDVLCELRATATAAAHAVVCDPTGSDELAQLLLDLAVRERTPGEKGAVVARPSARLVAYASPEQPRLPARIPSGEQSNTTVFYGHEFMLKLFRQLEEGENPDVELNEFLWASGYRHVPEPLGSLRYEGDGFTATLGIVQRFVPSAGSAWDVILERLEASLELARSMDASILESNLPPGDLLDSTGKSAPAALEPFLAPAAAFAVLLGERTAELHRALASRDDEPAFAPEPFTAEYQRALVQATRDRVTRAYALLDRQLSGLPDSVKALAREAIGCRDALWQQLNALETQPVRASRIRCHGDYHLGQVLYGESDFTILDFEGEPAQPLPDRRLPGSALYDVCGMLRSFHYAATVALQSERWADDRAVLACWGDAWYRWISALYLCAYLSKAREGDQGAVFLPPSPEELRALLSLHLIDKCSYELSYELNSRPAWVGVPLAGLIQLAGRR